MAIRVLKERGSSVSSIARTMAVTEGAVRYHLRRQAAGAVDGRSEKPRKAARWHEAITTWLASRSGDAISLAALYAWLVEEQGYVGSERSVQRYVRAAFPPPARRARRRVETPPGAQAQADWAEFRSVPFAEGPRDLYALHMQLSHSRFDVVVWSERKDQLACRPGIGVGRQPPVRTLRIALNLRSYPAAAFRAPRLSHTTFSLRPLPPSRTAAASRIVVTAAGTTRSGAGEGTRTLDMQLGKLPLYQLSYARGAEPNVA